MKAMNVGYQDAMETPMSTIRRFLEYENIIEQLKQQKSQQNA